MIHRTYFVYLPGTQRTAPNYVDICVRATMGTRALPVASVATYGAANVTAPPTGWVIACGDAAYYEVRGRSLPFDHLFVAGAAGGFVQRLNLGFELTVTPYGDWHSVIDFAPPSVQLSQSLLAAVGGDALPVIPANNLADPTYGVPQPVIRVYAPRDGEGDPVLDVLLLVCLKVSEKKDEDFTPFGAP